MFPHVIDMQRVLPELIWCGFGVLVMLLQPFVRSRQFFTFVALIGSLAGTVAAFTALAHGGPGFYGLVQSDAFSFFFRLLVGSVSFLDRKSTRLNSSHRCISYAVFCLKKKKKTHI